MSAFDEIEALVLTDDPQGSTFEKRLVSFAEENGWYELDDQQACIDYSTGGEVMEALYEYRNDERLDALDDDDVLRWVADYVGYNRMTALEEWIDQNIDEETAAKEYAEFVAPAAKACEVSDPPPF